MGQPGKRSGGIPAMLSTQPIRFDPARAEADGKRWPVKAVLDAEDAAETIKAINEIYTPEPGGAYLSPGGYASVVLKLAIRLRKEGGALTWDDIEAAVKSELLESLSRSGRLDAIREAKLSK